MYVTPTRQDLDCSSSPQTIKTTNVFPAMVDSANAKEGEKVSLIYCLENVLEMRDTLDEAVKNVNI